MVGGLFRGQFLVKNGQNNRKQSQFIQNKKSPQNSYILIVIYFLFGCCFRAVFGLIFSKRNYRNLLYFSFRTFVLIQKYQKIKAKRMPPALPIG